MECCCATVKFTSPRPLKSCANLKLFVLRSVSLFGLNQSIDHHYFHLQASAAPSLRALVTGCLLWHTNWYCVCPLAFYKLGLRVALLQWIMTSVWCSANNNLRWIFYSLLRLSAQVKMPCMPAQMYLQQYTHSSESVTTHSHLHQDAIRMLSSILPC